MNEPRTVRLVVAPDQYELAVDALWMLAPEAISEDTLVDGDTRLIAGFAEAAAARSAAEALSKYEPELVEVPETEWVDSWRALEPPYVVGPLRIRLPEHQPATTGAEVIIEPGISFGFSHASTRLAIELSTALPLSGAAVADVGCGTGVLAIVAATLGARRVDAVDTDPEAVTITSANVALNGVDVTAVVGSVSQLPESRYDVVLINVTAATLRQLAPALLDLVRPNGLIVASGMLHRQREQVAEAFRPRTAIDERSEGEWVAVILG